MSAAAALAVALPAPIVGQDPEPRFLNFGADTVFVDLHLDSMGVRPAEAADLEELATLLQGQGHTVERTLPGGTWVIRRGTPAVDGDAAVAEGRALYLTYPDLIATAGPLARPISSDIAFVYTDRVMVLYSPGTSPDSRLDVETTYGLELIHVSPTNPDMVRYHVTERDSAGYFQTLALLSQAPEVLWAYPDYTEGVAEAFTPDDEYFELQWHLGSGGTGNIDVTHAWDVTQGSVDVVIAVLEPRGFDIGQPDLIPNLWSDPLNASVHGWNYTFCTSNDPTCGNKNVDLPVTLYHGTAVAGLAAAAGNNTIGVAGVCFRCRFMPIVMGWDYWGRYLSFEWAETHGASVINASWSLPYDPLLAPKIGHVALDSQAGQGIPVIFAAGNDNKDACVADPRQGKEDATYLVGATDDQDLKTSWSNRGSCLDIVAPGGTHDWDVSIVSTDPLGDGWLNRSQVGSHGCTTEITTTFDYTRCFGGTSASAPLVAGVVGLMLSIDPTLETEEIYEILNKTADKVQCADAMYGGSVACPSDWKPRSDKYGFGRLNAFAALKETRTGVQCTDCSTPSFEVGARLGYTNLSGTTDETVWNTPGSGPRADPVLHLAAVTGGAPIGSWFWELQLGHSDRSQPAPADDTSTLALAFQAALMYNAGAGSIYAGPNFALRRLDDGMGSVTTPTAWGGAVGYRYVAFSHLVLRLEGRYRSWSDGVDELGVAAIFGVRIP